MIEGSGELLRWTARRWWAFIVLVFATQLGLIFWLGKPRTTTVRHEDPALSLRLINSKSPGPFCFTNSALTTAETLALIDPTLFALPHREAFSGQAWLNVPVTGSSPAIESSQPLLLSTNDLGTDFVAYMDSHQLNQLPSFAEPKLVLRIPSVVEPSLFATQSALRLTGALAGRRLLQQPDLPSWPAAEILTNTVVQVMVTADGKVLTANLVRPASGSGAADQKALLEARNARFEPLSFDPTEPLAHMAWGQMVFEWHTVPLQVTNAPSPVRSQ